jgi:DNA-binding response OmpR family regulator
MVETRLIILRILCYGVILPQSQDIDLTEQLFVDNVIDLVILDHGLRGITGSELAKRFKARKNVLILMLSGSPELLGIPESVDLLLPKPIAVPTLLTEIEQLFVRSRT